MDRTSPNTNIDAPDREITDVVAASFWQRLAARFGWTSVSDGLVGGAGAATALTCAGFAAYMSTHPNPSFNGVEHLMIFAQPNYRDEASLMASAGAAGGNGVDYLATGAIRPIDKSRLAASKEPIVTNYTLHFVQGGEALIVGKDEAVYRVALGSVVPGIGRVIAIEERHGEWVVVTPRGLIVAR